MAQQTISGLRQGLRSAESRLDTLAALGQIESFDEKLAEELVDDLVYALDRESNAYTLLQALREMRRVSQQHPEIASEGLLVTTEVVNDTLRDFEGDDPSENRKASWGADILESILGGTKVEDGTIDIEYDDVRGLLQEGTTRHRVIGYRLLGRAATGQSVRLLLQDFSHEVDEVKEARDRALNEACELVTGTLDGREAGSRVDAIDAFTELHKAEVIDPDPRQMRSVRRIVSDLVSSVDAERRDRFLSAVERLAQCDADTANTIVTESLEALADERSSSDQYERWGVLRACAEGAPTVLLDRSDAVADLLLTDDHTETRRGLDIVETAAEQTSSVPPVLADPVLRLLDSDEKDTLNRAIDTVAVMGFYPPPEQLIELMEEGDSSTSRLASRARDRLLERDRGHEFVDDLESGSSNVSLFAGDEGDVYLKRRAGNGYWTGLEIGELREGIVEAAIGRLEREENVPIVYPYYEPRDVVLLTIALTLVDPEKDRQIGLYSPGSQTQWGTKGEVREELRRYALSDEQGAVVGAAPLPEIVPESYVWDGDVKDNSEGEGPGRIVLVKDTLELTDVSNLDVVVVNSVSRNRVDQSADIEELEKAHPDAVFVSTYSCYTRHERDERRPQYGPPAGLESAQTIPGADLLDPALAYSDSLSDARRSGDWDGKDQLLTYSEDPTSTDRSDISANNEWRSSDDVRGFSRTAEIRIEHVESEVLSHLFDQLFEESGKLRDTDAAGAGGLIFSRQMFFERLPIPTGDYDEWVQTRYMEGDRFVPPLVRERIDDVEQKAGVVENLQAVQPLNTAKNILERIDDQLRDDNPLFRALQTYVSEARRNESRLAIFSGSPKHAQLLRDTLSKYEIVSESVLDSGPISVVSPNDARDMSPHDILLVFGALHPENAGFYVHPRVDETVVVTYDRSWSRMIDRHSSEYVDLLNGALGGSDYSPFQKPELVGDVAPDQTAEESKDEEDPTSSREGTKASTESKAQVLEEVIRSASVSEYRDNTGRYERELRHYLVETSSGDRLDLTNHDRILRQRTTVTGDELHWTSPETLTTGDTIVTIPDDVERELWEKRLEELYEEGIGAHTAAERLRTWYDALVEIWNRVETEVGGSDVPETEVYETLHGWITHEVDEFERTSSTVQGWFRSINEADHPIDLARDPSLITGPRSYRDIEAIGRAFGYDELVTEAEEIGEAMEGIRAVNRREGHEYRDTLREKVESEDSTHVSEAASYHEVAAIQERDDESEAGSSKPSTTDGLADELLERVTDLVELSPTKNSELADEWGYDSGSEVYKFLSSELDGYYERNDDKLIVPTEKARRVVDEATDQA